MAKIWILGNFKQKANKKHAISRAFCLGGDKGTRTLGLCVANASLYQLSHIPIYSELLKSSAF